MKTTLQKNQKVPLVFWIIASVFCVDSLLEIDV